TAAEAARTPRSRQRPGRAGRASARAGSEAALAAGIFAQRLLELRLAEIRPHHVEEDELRIGALPQQEIGQPLLAGGADDQVGVRNAVGRQEPRESILV